MKDKPLLSTLLRLSPLVKPFLIISVSLLGVFELIKILPLYIFKEIIDALTAKTLSPLSYIAILVGGYFASMLVMTAFEAFGQFIMYTRVRGVEADVTTRTFRKLLSLDIKYHEDHNTGENVNKILKGTSRLVELLYNLIDRFIPTCLQTLVTFIILLFTDIYIALSYAILVPLFIIVILKDSKKTQYLREQYHRYHDKYAGIITQSLSNIRTVKDFNNETKEDTKATTTFSKYVDYAQQRTNIGVRNIIIEDGLVNFARATTLLLSVWLMLHGNISAGSLVFIVSLTEKAYINLTKLSRVYFHMQDSEPSIHRFDALLRTHSTIADGDSAKKVAHGRIDFANVSFAYNKENALEHVSFTVLPKEVVALVGRSGSGKTTIMKLLLRHFDANKGRITIDGTDIRDYTLKNLRERIAIVSQDVELFNDTIYANIAYGVHDAKREDVINAAKLAFAHDFIMSFPKKYNTVIGERGIRLSGGQKQRLAIARAILRKPKILVFDEATSALDSESEQYIHQSIMKLIGKMTLIIIAHRFSTIEHANKIILLEKGNVKEIGTHRELIAKKGIFSKLRKLQQLGEMRET